MEMGDIQTTDMPMQDLRGRSTPGEVKFGITGKIIGALVVVVLVGAVGTYAYETRPMPKPQQHVSLNQLPELPANPPAPQQTQQ
jgi:hypothetical protein